MGNGLLAHLLRGRVPQVGRSDGWPPRLLRELDRIPPTGRLTVNLAGARRTDTALERLRQQTNAADAVVFPSQVGVAHPHWERLADRPEVRTLAVWDLLFGSYDGQPGAIIFGSKNGTYLGKVENPVVVQGRMFNPHSSDEVVVDENSIGQVPPVGGTFTYQFYGSNQSTRTPSHLGVRTVTMHVVGVVRDAPEFLFVSDGQVFVSPGFLARYGSRIQTAENADVILRHGAADIGALRHDVDTFLVPGTPVLDTHATSRRVNTTLAVETTALLLLAAAILLGGGILMAQVLGRSAATIADDSLALRALGMSRTQLGLATGLSHVVSTVGGRADSIRGGASALDSVPGRARPTDRPRRGLPRRLDRGRRGPRLPSSSQPFSPVFLSVEGRLANVLRADVPPPHQEPSVVRHLLPSGWARQWPLNRGEDVGASRWFQPYWQRRSPLPEWSPACASTAASRAH